MQTVEILRGAKAVLQERGWYQGNYYNEGKAGFGIPVEECEVCLMGAINVAAGGSPDHIGIESGAVHEYITSILKARHESRVKVAYWNDLKKRRVEDVLALLDVAIERAVAGDVR
jgi:hypothetical protein